MDLKAALVMDFPSALVQLFVFRGWLLLVETLDLFEVKQIVKQAAETLLNDLRKAHLFNEYEEQVISSTISDIIGFKQSLIMLNDALVPANKKREAAIFVKGMNEAFKKLYEMVGERCFTIFYNSYIEDKTRNAIANALNIDVATVRRNKKKALLKLSMILYPELSIMAMFR